MNDLRRAFDRMRSDDCGIVALWVAILAPVLFGLCAIAVDVARWYVELERAQKVADAAALGGVIFMPQDFDQAQSTALDIAGRNGYPNGGDVVIDVERTSRPTELKVTVTSTIDNSFARIFGNDQTTLSRSGISDYSTPPPIGSPCNVLGNEPNAGLLGPPGSVLPSPLDPDCSRTPQFWGNIHGPDVDKVQGDQFMPRVCEGGEVFCDGDTNQEFSALGYFMTLKVEPQAVGKPLRVQVFDPAFVDVGGACTALSTTTTGLRNAMNPFTGDGNARYLRGRTGFCTGDQYFGGTERPTTTSFGVREQTDTQIPSNGAPITACAQQFYGHATPAYTNLRSDNGNYRLGLARVYRQWVDLCTFTPTRSGDYYVQVRTNIACGTPITTGANAGTCSNRLRVYTQAGDDPGERGNGANRFAVRAVPSTVADRAAVSVSGYANFPIYANSSSDTAEFPLVRLLPGARGKTLVFTFFDPGDGVSNGRVRIEPPSDGVTINPDTGTASPLTTFTGCTGEERAALSTSGNCVVNGIGGGATPTWQGQIGVVNIPVPEYYDCGRVVGGSRVYGPADCWVRVELTYPGGTVTDATTWSAKLEGDPVRLVE